MDIVLELLLHIFFHICSNEGDENGIGTDNIIDSHFSICRESDLRGDLSRDLHNHDKHFKPDTTFLLNEKEKTRKKKEDNNKKTFKPRPIVHPKFQNLSTEDAIEVTICIFLKELHFYDLFAENLM